MSGQHVQVGKDRMNDTDHLTCSTLFLIAAVQYTYVTYLGYNALPFVARSEILLAPLLPIFGG